MAGIYANTAAAILSFIFATVWFKPKSKQEASKQINIDPSLIVGIGFGKMAAGE